MCVVQPDLEVVWCSPEVRRRSNHGDGKQTRRRNRQHRRAKPHGERFGGPQLEVRRVNHRRPSQLAITRELRPEVTVRVRRRVGRDANCRRGWRLDHGSNRRSRRRGRLGAGPAADQQHGSKPRQRPRVHHENPPSEETRPRFPAELAAPSIAAVGVATKSTTHSAAPAAVPARPGPSYAAVDLIAAGATQVTTGLRDTRSGSYRA